MLIRLFPSKSFTERAILNSICSKSIYLFILMNFLWISQTYSQGVSINNSGNRPDTSAILDVQSANKGLLIPQLSLSSLSDATTIPLPSHSLLVYNTNSALTGGKGYYYNSGTTGSPSWSRLTSSTDLLAMAAIGSTPNANGASISGNSLNLQPANGTFGGVVTTSAQTFAGDKTFSGAIAASNLSGTNTGDNAVNSLYSGLVSNATHTGDATGSTALTVVKINGTSLAGLATGLLKNTTGTGVPSIATGADIPNITQSQVTNLTTDLSLLAPKASPTFTGTVTMPSPVTLGGTSVTTTGTQLNYLNAATGTTGTTSSNLVYSTSPLLSTPRLASTSTNGYVWTATDAIGNGSWQNATGVNTVSAIGSTPNANGASIAGNTLNLQPADATYGGIVTAGAQTIAGAKTFSGAISASNLSGTNTGDNAVNSLYSGLVSNATHTGDAVGSTALTVVKINGTSLAGLATGLLKNTTGTGVPSIATGADIPNITQSQVTNLTTDLSLLAPKASPTFTGTVTMPSPVTLGGTSVTTTGTQLNYLNAATGTTGTTSSKLVYSTSPLLTTPRLASTSTSGYVWTATDTIGNGTWQSVPNFSSASNLVYVYSLSDLPTPSGSAITLNANKMYIFSGLVNISPNYLNLNGAGLRGTDPAKDGVMSSVSGAILRSTGVSVFIEDFATIPLSASTKAYDFADATGLQFCNIFSGSSVVEAGVPSLGVGQISGFKAITIADNYWNCKDGIKVTGTVGKFCSAYNFITGITSGSGIEFLAGLTIDDIDLSNNYFIYTGQTGVKVNAGATIDRGRMTTNMFRGVSTYTSGFDSYSPAWEMRQNTLVPNSRALGSLYLSESTTPTATSLTTVSTYYKIAGTTTAGTLQRFTASSNRLTYIGNQQITGKVIAIIGARSPCTNGDFTIVIAKNGTAIANPTGSMAPSANNQSFQITLATEVDLSTNDYVEVFIRTNNSGTNTITIDNIQFRVTD